ncbi:MAG: efflux RND transporter periplasmic adaptor subunit [Gammaproteobacteria bacterium]|nr:efflux RND transporter periplasmic adaptor subunit [Gammaproteobacteria bacterium]
MRNILIIAVCFIVSVNTGILHADDNDTLAVLTVEKQTIPLEQYVDGVIEAVNQSTVSAQTSGTIVKLRFDVNDYVRKDDVIAEFKNTEQKAAVAKAEAGLRSALAQQRDASAEHDRIARVFKEGVVSKSSMDKAIAALKGANASVDAARAELTRSLEQLDYTLIRAPYSGIVTKRHAEVGEVAAPGKPIMTGLSLDDLRVLSYVPQRMIDSITRYQQARVIVMSAEGPRGFHSNRLTVFPFANQSSHAMAVRVELPPNVKNLFPGMYVKVAFLIGEQQRLLIPRSALVRRSEVSAVYIKQKDGYVTMRQIKPGRHVSDDQIEVLAGIDIGEQLILDPEDALAEYKAQQEKE